MSDLSACYEAEEEIKRLKEKLRLAEEALDKIEASDCIDCESSAVAEEVLLKLRGEK